MTMPGGTLDLPVGEEEKVPPKPKLEEIKLEGDDVPESLRGKTAKELVDFASNTAKALATSEAERQRLASAPPQPVVVQALPPPPVVEPELSNDELKTLWDKDAIAAVQYLQTRGNKRLEENLLARLGGLTSSAATVAEQGARARYVEEFAAIGPEIEQLVKERVKDKSILADPAIWDDLIRYARGTHFEKIVAHRAAADTTKREVEARAAQAVSAGATITSVGSAAHPAKGAELDDFAKSIARTQFPGLSDQQAFAEYTKWRDMAI